MSQHKGKIGLGIVGSGRWGKNHVSTANRLFPEILLAVCDENPENLSRALSLAPQAEGLASLDQLIENPKINAVIIATPAVTHFKIAKKCLEAGKHILVEKPLALNTFEARELTEIGKSRNLTVMVGHIMLFHPAIEALKELIQKGELGRLQYIYSNRLNLGSVRQEENILWSFAPHDVSIFQHLIQAKPTHVEAIGSCYLQPGVHDITMTNLKYANGINGHIHVSWLHPFKEHRLVVVGDKCMAVFEDTKEKDKLVLHPKGIDIVEGKVQTRNKGSQVVPIDSESPLDREQKHFLACILEKRTPRTDGVHAIEVLEILERATNKMTKDEVSTIEGVSIHPTAAIDENVSIGTGTKIWHFSHLQSGSKVGKNCSIGQNVNIGNNVQIGNQVKIQNNVSVYEGVELEDYVFCGPSMVFTNIKVPRCEFPQRGSKHYLPTKIKVGASLGANCTILCGTEVGKYAFVAAGAVVTKNIPEDTLVKGNLDCLKCERTYSMGRGNLLQENSSK